MTAFRAVMIACALALAVAPSFAQTSVAPAPSVAAPDAAASQFEACGIFVRQGGHSNYIALPDFSIITAPSPLTLPAGQPHPEAVICDRRSIFIARLDYRVMTDLHVPLFLRNGDRMATLEVVNGQLRIRFVHGEPTYEERVALVSALDDANGALQAPAAAHP